MQQILKNAMLRLSGQTFAEAQRGPWKTGSEKTMNVEQLSEFCTVVQYQSITKAAEKLFISQPSLSRHISDLELSLGTKLIERGNSRVFSLTKAGELLYREGQKILESIAKAEQHIQRLGSGAIGNLRISARMMDIPVFAQLVHSFIQDSPEVDVCVYDMEGEPVVSCLLGGHADIALAYNYDICQHMDELQSLHVQVDHFAAMISKFNSLAGEDHVTIQQLQQQQSKLLLVRSPEEGILDKGSLEYVFSLFQANERPTLSINSALMRTQLDQGFFIMPSLVARTHRDICKIMRIEDLDAELEVLLVWDPENDNPCLRRFVEYARENLPRNNE